MPRRPGASMLEVIESPAAMRAWADARIGAGQRLALVPTMGYLHDGHLSLVRAARRRADAVVVSIFVNPSQFGPGEDLERYPRDLAGDVDKLQGLADAVFTPEAGAIYAEGFDTWIVPDRMAAGLCGASRPAHFRGVCTVVALLFRITRCQVAVFGEKDYQQLQIIRRMTRDLWLDVEVVGVPIAREPDGLAMSSRNAYLDPRERREALALSRALGDVAARVREGERDVDVLLAGAREAIEAGGVLRIDYLAVVEAGDLTPLRRVDQPAVCAVAAFAGKTRLIDNVRLEPAPG